MKVSVRHDAVADTVAKLALAVHDFEKELETLDSEVLHLKAAWNGDSQRAYEHAQRDWSVAIEAMKALLAEATRRLVTANSISMATASNAAQTWS